MRDLEGWRRPQLEARLWWCGDETCDCRQPQIDKIEPNLEAGYPWIKRTEVWRGTFKSQGEDLLEQVADLRVAAAERGIDLDENDYGRKPLT